jgi:hypothetical protein
MQAFACGRTLSIRRGAWEYVAHRDSGGNSQDKAGLKSYAQPDTHPEAAGPLTDLITDLVETTNLRSKNPENVKELHARLAESPTTHRRTLEAARRIMPV